jgi:hypothetical protein
LYLSLPICPSRQLRDTTQNFIFRQFYEPDKSALENYQASPMLRMGFIPYLERHAPERVQAVRQRYAAEIAAVEERIAALS